MLVVDPNRRATAGEILSSLNEIEVPQQQSPRNGTLLTESELPSVKGLYESHLESRRV